MGTVAPLSTLSYVAVGVSRAGEAENEVHAVLLAPVHRLAEAVLPAHLPGDRFHGLTERIPVRRGQEWSGGCFRVIPNRFPALNSASPSKRMNGAKLLIYNNFAPFSMVAGVGFEPTTFRL